MEQHPHHTGRSIRIDILRGVAVLGMIVAHALFFLHDRSNSFFVYLERFLNMTVFTLFVFVFGQSLSKWLDLHAFDHFKKILLLSLRRAGIFYLAYLITAGVAVFSYETTLLNLISILTLSSPPNFTEYMPLFIVITLLIPILRPLFRFTRTSILLTFVIGAFFYLLGITAQGIVVPDFLIGIKTLFAGGSVLRFPVLLYLPVVLWGLWWQHDSDHNTQDKIHTARHFWLLAGGIAITLVGVVFNRNFNIPLLNPNIRWPPSVSFLTLGMSIAGISLFLMPSFTWVGTAVKHILAYFGRDALDIWLNHLLILFLYKRFVGLQFGDPLMTIAVILVFIWCTVLMSSIVITNRIRFPFGIVFTGTTRFRKRYIIYSVLGLAVLLLSFSSTSSPYGNFMNVPALTFQQKLPVNIQAKLTTDSTWYVKRSPNPQFLELVVTLKDAEKNIPVNTDLVKIYMNSRQVDFTGLTASDGTLHFTKPVADILPGTYMLTARINNIDSTIETNPVAINISEPLLVSWTFDWEGWDVPDKALSEISDLTFQYPTLKFSHFVNPRTFLPGVLTVDRKNQIIAFLNDRHSHGDEIALHLHMHFDLVRAAGIPIRTTNAWGLRTEEGYDVPITEYDAEEFEQIVSYAQSVAVQSGLPVMTGFRAGGWFLNTSHLNELRGLGFSYDSSGRDRPATGAFKNTPWNLPVGAQPYFPSRSDQNLSSVDSGNVLEIPTNGLSTFDQPANMLISRISTVYSGGVLLIPKVLVFVSHPQFYSREFSKIQPVLRQINAVLQISNRGPAVFVTTAEIANIWSTLNK